MLRTKELFLSREGYCHCHLLTLSSTQDYEVLISNQEEADTRLILHAKHALDTGIDSVLIRLPSRDTDIIILALFHLFHYKENVFLDSGRIDARRLIPMETLDMGFHAFTGNDYVSCFFTKAKIFGMLR